TGSLDSHGAPAPCAVGRTVRRGPLRTTAPRCPSRGNPRARCQTPAPPAGGSWAPGCRPRASRSAPFVPSRRSPLVSKRNGSIMRAGTRREKGRQEIVHGVAFEREGREAEVAEHRHL